MGACEPQRNISGPGVRRLENPRPTYIPTIRYVKRGHTHFPLFEDLIDRAENRAAPASPPPLPPTTSTAAAPPSYPSDPLVERDLENTLREQSNPHGQGYIYLIRMSRIHFLKISMSLDSQVRLRTLQTGNSLPLHPVST